MNPEELKIKEKYKYSISFASKIKLLESIENETKLAIASLDNLKKFLPDVNIEDNIDFLPLAIPAFTANVCNANGDAVLTDEALKISDLFYLKPLNVEHSRQKVCGVIISSNFSEIDTDKRLSRDNVKNSKKPFNVTLGAILWKIINEDFTDIVESSNDPKSEFFNKIYGSWELMFSSFLLASLPNNSNNLEDAKLITDPKKISELEKRLKSYGGNGKLDDGTKLCRIPTDAIPVGLALTESPAGLNLNPITIESSNADIKIINEDSKSNIDINVNINELELSTLIKEKVIEVLEQSNLIGANLRNSIDTKIDIKKPSYTYNILPPMLTDKLKNLPESGAGYHTCDIEMMDGTKLSNINVTNCSVLPDNIDGSKIKNINIKLIKASELSVIVDNNKNIDKSQNFSVNQNNHMKLNTRQDITDENIKQCSASEVTSLLDVEVRKISDKFENDKKTIEESKKEVDTLLANTKTELDNTKKSLVDIQDSLKKLQESQAAKDKEEKFTIRMTAWENDYDLDEETKEIVASDIKDLDDKGYESWSAKMKVIMKDKKKTIVKNIPIKKGILNKDVKNDGDPEDKKDNGADEYKEDKNGKILKKNVKASVDDPDKTLDNAIDNGDKKDSDKVIDASKVNAEPTLKDKYKASFGAADWSIDARRLKRIKN